MDRPLEQGLLGAIRSVLRRPVRPDFRLLVSFGWAAAALMVVLGLSGALLSIYYLPAVDAAAESVRFVMRDVAWGWLVRGVHRWGASLLVLCALLQMVRVFLAGSYRGAGAGSWVLGTLLLLTVLALSFTGQLLPWDEDALGLATAALAGTDRVPLVGPPLASAMRGGSEVGVATLARAHAAHALVLPWLAFLLLLVELWFRSRRAGGAR
jgi:quinol-cytochrome oxidoreductase complex cytochrome b subunit